MIQISDWTRYEVDAKGHAWQDGEVIRRKPLDYVRVPAHGAHWTPSYRDLLECGGRDAAAALGVFVKLLELCARQTSNLRGSVPGDVDGLRRAMGFPADVIASALDVLGRAGWITVHDALPESSETSEVPGTPGMPGMPETSGRFLKGKGRVKERETAESPADPPAPSPDGDPCGNEAPEADPLEGYPDLAEFYPRLNAMIVTENTAAKLPKTGTPADLEARKTLAKLCYADGYLLGGIAACLTWLFESEHKDAAFWRKQVFAVGPLRKSSDGAKKFDRIFKDFERATAGGNGKRRVEPECTWTSEDTARLEAELAEEAAAKGPAS